MTRRRFLNGMGQVIGALSLTTAGCGSGSPKSEEPARQVKVSVPPELSGNDRTLYSAYAKPSALDTEGRAFTRSSNSGAQLLVLADGRESPRALTVTLPNVGTALMDATTTAAALVFLTPGILSTLPEEAQTRLNQIRALPSFTAFRLAVEAALPSRSLSDLQFDAEIVRLRTGCVGEWMGGRAAKTTRSRGWQDDPARFSVEFHGGDAIELRSGAWRDGGLWRERLDSRNRPVSDAGGPVVTPMEGAAPLTWGALFSPSRFSLGRRSDRPEVNGEPPVGTIRYTVYGPGYPAADLPAPAVFEALDPYGPTFFFAGALPILDLALGGTAALSRGWLAARKVWEGLSGRPDVSAARQFIRQQDLNRAAEQVLPLVSGCLAEADAIAAGYGLLAANPLLVPEATSIIRMARFALSAASFLPAVETWAAYPEVSVYELPVTSGEVVVK